MPSKRALASVEPDNEAEDVLSWTANTSNHSTSDSNSNTIPTSRSSIFGSLRSLGSKISQTLSPRPTKKQRRSPLPESMNGNNNHQPSSSNSLYPNLPQTSLYPSLPSNTMDQEQEHLSADDSARHIALLPQSPSSTPFATSQHQQQDHDDDDEIEQDLTQQTSSSTDGDTSIQDQSQSQSSPSTTKGKGKGKGRKKGKGKSKGKGKQKQSQVDEKEEEQTLEVEKEEEENAEESKMEVEEENQDSNIRDHEGIINSRTTLGLSSLPTFLDESALADASTIGLPPRSEGGHDGDSSLIDLSMDPNQQDEDLDQESNHHDSSFQPLNPLQEDSGLSWMASRSNEKEEGEGVQSNGIGNGKDADSIDEEGLLLRPLGSASTSKLGLDSEQDQQQVEEEEEPQASLEEIEEQDPDLSQEQVIEGKERQRSLEPEMDEDQEDEEENHFKASSEVRSDADEPIGQNEEEDEEILIQRQRPEESSPPSSSLIGEEEKEVSSTSFTNGATVVDLTGSDDEEEEDQPEKSFTQNNGDLASGLGNLSLTRNHHRGFSNAHSISESGSVGGFSNAGSFRAPSYARSSIAGSGIRGQKNLFKPKKDPIGMSDHKDKVRSHNLSKKTRQIELAFKALNKGLGSRSRNLTIEEFTGKVLLGGRVKRIIAQSDSVNQRRAGKPVQIETEEFYTNRYLKEIFEKEKRASQSVLPVPQYKLDEHQRLKKEKRLREKKARGVLGRRPLPFNLDKEQEEKVRDTFRRSGKVSTIPGAEVSSQDIVKLKPGQWLNDEVINFYGIMVLRRSEKAEEARKKAKAAGTKWDRSLNAYWRAHYFSSFFFSRLSDEGYTAVKKWSKRVDLFTLDIVLIPINLGNSHWVCGAINLRKKRFEYYDSLGAENKRAFKIMRNYLVEEAKDKKKGNLDLSDWTDYFNERNPHQQNGFDCGVFASITLEQISRRDPHTIIPDALKWSNEEGRVVGWGTQKEDEDEDEEEEETGERDWNFSQENMPYLRKRMVYEIASQGLIE